MGLSSRIEGKALPTEAEWEFAARGGIDGAEYVWGDEFTPQGRQYLAGRIPVAEPVRRRFEWTAPVGTLPANGYGLHEMTGKCLGMDRRLVSGTRKDLTLHNPRGGDRDASYGPRETEINIPRKVMKGGSYLCAPNYCQRYRPAARMSQPIDTSTCHHGFRCIVRPGQQS